MEEYKALCEIMKDVIDQKREQTKFLFICLIISIVINLVEIGAFLYFESQWEYGTEKTVTTTEQTVDGDDGSIVNGDQYNDRSVNQSEGDK